MIFRRAFRLAEAIDYHLDGAHEEVNRTIVEGRELIKTLDRLLSRLGVIAKAADKIADGANQARRILRWARGIPVWGQAIAQAIRKALTIVREIGEIVSRGIRAVRPVAEGIRHTVLRPLARRMRPIKNKFGPVRGVLNDVMRVASFLEPQQWWIEPLMPVGLKLRISAYLTEFEQQNQRAAVLLAELKALNDQLAATNGTIKDLFLKIVDLSRVLETLELTAQQVADTVRGFIGNLPEPVKKFIDNLTELLGMLQEWLIEQIRGALDELGLDARALLAKFDAWLRDLAAALPGLRELGQKLAELVAPMEQVRKLLEGEIAAKLKDLLALLSDIEKSAAELRALLSQVGTWKFFCEAVLGDVLIRIGEELEEAERALQESSRRPAVARAPLERAVHLAAALEAEITSVPLPAIGLEHTLAALELSQRVQADVEKALRILGRPKPGAGASVAVSAIIAPLAAETARRRKLLAELVGPARTELPRGYFGDFRRLLDEIGYRELGSLGKLPEAASWTEQEALPRFPAGDARFDRVARAYEEAGLLPRRPVPRSIAHLDPKTGRKLTSVEIARRAEVARRPPPEQPSYFESLDVTLDLGPRRAAPSRGETSATARTRSASGSRSRSREGSTRASDRSPRKRNQR